MLTWFLDLVGQCLTFASSQIWLLMIFMRDTPVFFSDLINLGCLLKTSGYMQTRYMLKGLPLITVGALLMGQLDPFADHSITKGKSIMAIKGCMLSNFSL